MTAELSRVRLRVSPMPDAATAARAENPLLGTLFVLLAALAAAGASARAAAQESGPKDKEPADSSPSDKLPGKAKAGSQGTDLPLPVGAVRRFGAPAGDGDTN